MSSLPDVTPATSFQPDAYMISGMGDLPPERLDEFAAHLAAIVGLGLRVESVSPEEDPPVTAADLTPYRYGFALSSPFISSVNFVNAVGHTTGERGRQLGQRIWSALSDSQANPNSPTQWLPLGEDYPSLFSPTLASGHYLDEPAAVRRLNLEKLANVLHETDVLNGGRNLHTLSRFLPHRLGPKGVTVLCHIVNQLLQPQDPVDVRTDDPSADLATAESLFLESDPSQRDRYLVTMRSFLRYVYGEHAHQLTPYMRPDVNDLFRMLGQHDKQNSQAQQTDTDTEPEPTTLALSPQRFAEAAYTVLGTADQDAAFARTTGALLHVYTRQVLIYAKEHPSSDLR